MKTLMLLVLLLLTGCATASVFRGWERGEKVEVGHVRFVGGRVYRCVESHETYIPPPQDVKHWEQIGGK